MKDCAYFIPGYTGFCPELREHFGETYGDATRKIIREKAHLRHRLSAIHYSCRTDKNKLKCGLDYDRHRECKGDYPEPYRTRPRVDCSGDERKIDHRMDYQDPCRPRPRIDYTDGDERKRDLRMDYGDVCRHKPRIDYTVGDERKREHRVDYLDPCRAKPRVDYTDGDERKMDHRMDYQDPCRAKLRLDYKDGDRIRGTVQECLCPRYVYVERYAEFPPECSGQLDRGDRYHVHYPAFMTEPCQYEAEFPQILPTKQTYEQEYRMRKKSRVLPYRQGVIPKYTGHIPGMQFSFGESYGPASDRLLRRHHDNIKRLSRRL